MGVFRVTLVLGTLVVVLSTMLGLALARFGDGVPGIGMLLGGDAQTQTSSTSVVLEDIQQLNELTTVRWTQSTVIEAGDRGNILERAFTDDSVVLVATGEVDAGVDLEQMEPEDLRVEEDTVTVSLPEPEILSNRLDEDETYTYDTRRGLATRVFGSGGQEVADEARREASRSLMESAEENSILAQAEQNAEDSIRAFLTSLEFEEVVFE